MNNPSQPQMTRVYAGTPAPARRAARREQLMAAGYELFGTDGYTATTVRGICGLPRLNQRYFYESFDSRDALLVAVFDQVVEEAAEVMLEAVSAAGDDPVARLSAAVESVARHLTEDPRRARVAFVEAPGSALLAAHRHAAERRLSRLVTAQLSADGRSKSNEPVIDAAITLVGGGVSQMLIGWLDGRVDLEHEEFVEAVVALVLSIAQGAAAFRSTRWRSGTITGTRVGSIAPRAGFHAA